MLTVAVADKSGLTWAQEHVKQHHYLHTPADDRCSPVAMLVTLFGERVGCLIFGRPEATRVNGWYGSVIHRREKQPVPSFQKWIIGILQE